MAEVNHTARKHALLSASGADRWMNCTPSARIEEKVKDKTSTYAEEGTLAHEFANLELFKYFGNITEKEYNREIKKLRKHELYSDEMESEVEKYTEFCIQTFQESNTKNDAVVLIEEKLDFSHVVEHGYGTGDFGVVADKILDITDLKYGKGVRVSAERNSQLMLYGVGALRKYDLLYDIDFVRLTIVQPRLDHIDSFMIPKEDLLTWAEEEVKPKAALAYKGEGEQVVGDWCKFCKVKAVCRAMTEYNKELIKFEFRDPQQLNDQEMLEIYSRLDLLVDWAGSVKSHMLETALTGKVWKGLKLVEGRSNRKWQNEKAVENVLKSLGYTKSKYTKSALKGISDIEKLVGKADFKEKLSELVIKPQGAPTLVPESDKRPAFGSEQAKADFSGPIEE